MITFERNKETFLLISAFIMPLIFSVWMVLLNNFVVEKANFTGKEIGFLQSIREIPGFLAFTAIYLLLFIKEQSLAILSLLITCIGVALTGMFPTEYGLYLTTLVMSIGFHYFETVNQSLTLQWIDKGKTAHFLGQLLSVRSVASLLAYSAIWWMMSVDNWEFKDVYLFWGIVAAIFTLFLFLAFPEFEQPHEQKKSLILRKRYWLFYALTFFSGARRQIFIVFAGFLMVQKFGYSVADVSTLFIINYVFNWAFAAKIGKWVGRVGERKALTFEYVGLIILFIAYGLVENSTVAAALYVIDHLLFSLAIAIKTYFQKIADEKDIASTAGVSFTINHVAAVVIPAALGFIWLISHSVVFFIGASFALCSLLLAFLIPAKPDVGNEVDFAIAKILPRTK
ncbi:MFS transporter [Aliikangiella marina]|uniref:MFS transporter n=1 Tax=Aliikangiella marina TaxID=1712262 RepID=A0A545T2F8_9GAMM|nr:MFS transporter [Aliikangiella marina]TQV71398.1 MFS transporter [Aliikangiella marina]